MRCVTCRPASEPSRASPGSASTWPTAAHRARGHAARDHGRPSCATCPSPPPTSLALPRRRVEADFHCVAGWSAVGLHWEGVAVADLYRLVVEPALDAGDAGAVRRVRRHRRLPLDRHPRRRAGRRRAAGRPARRRAAHGRARCTDPAGQPGAVRLRQHQAPRPHRALPERAGRLLPPGPPRQLALRTVRPHARARVWHEERHRHVPSWLIRPIYHRLVRLPAPPLDPPVTRPTYRDGVSRESLHGIDPAEGTRDWPGVRTAYAVLPRTSTRRSPVRSIGVAFTRTRTWPTGSTAGRRATYAGGSVICSGHDRIVWSCVNEPTEALESTWTRSWSAASAGPRASTGGRWSARAWGWPTPWSSGSRRDSPPGPRPGRLPVRDRGEHAGAPADHHLVTEYGESGPRRPRHRREAPSRPAQARDRRRPRPGGGPAGRPLTLDGDGGCGPPQPVPLRAGVPLDRRQSPYAFVTARRMDRAVCCCVRRPCASTSRPRGRFPNASHFRRVFRRPRGGHPAATGTRLPGRPGARSWARAMRSRLPVS